jgi:hypothetical protein
MKDHDCYYCKESGHFSRECPHKIEHINKGWLAFTDSKHKLGDGNYIPMGDGIQKQRVDTYWKNKAISQNRVGALYDFEAYKEAGRPMDFHEMAMDKIRTLKVQLAKARQVDVQNSVPQVVQPTCMAQTQPTAVLPLNFDFGQAFQSWMIKSMSLGELPVTQDQFAMTRTGLKTGA